MNELDDVILPDDFDTPVETTEESDNSIDLDTDTTESTNEVENVELTESVQETPQSLRVKYNHEERDISLDEARELAQKGLNYEKAVERARQEARDAYIAEQGYTWNGKQIATESEYQQALREQELIQTYQNQDLPEEVIQKLLQVDALENRFNEQQMEAERQASERKQFEDFVQAFPEVDPTTIPKEVWDKVGEGVPLKYAYMEREVSQLRTLAKVQTQNKLNKQKPIPSVTSFGENEPEKSKDAFLEGFDSY
jgi:hypothetical protein